MHPSTPSVEEQFIYITLIIGSKGPIEEDSALKESTIQMEKTYVTPHATDQIHAIYAINYL